MQKENFYKLIENPDLLNQETLSELRDLTNEFPYFQAAWMLYLKNLKETNDAGFDEGLKKAALFIPDRKQLYHFLHQKNDKYASAHYFGKDQFSPENQDNSKDNSLIDKFLSAAPGHIKLKEPSQDDSKTENEILEKSSIENHELITETLANIYLAQKKYDKALQAFKKLSLKYPEKSIYFASLIEKTEILKNL